MAASVLPTTCILALTFVPLVAVTPGVGYRMEYNNVPDAIRLGQIIKEYRREHKLSQESLALILGVDGKTLRSWEHGQFTFLRNDNKKKLHDVLDIPLEILGVREHFTEEGALKLHKRIPTFLEQASYFSVRETSDLLMQGCTAPENRSRSTMRRILAHAFYTKGLATATLTNKSREALHLYEQMERAAIELNDPTGIDIARTYQGDAYRRMDNYDEAQRLLEEVIEQYTGRRFIGIEALVVGNCRQLLGRVYLAQGKKEKALDTLKRAEELAYASIPERERDWYICFCPCSVKEELAKSLMLLHKFRMSFEALEEANRLAQNSSARWAIPIAITQGEAFVRYGRRNDDRSFLKKGWESLSEGYALAKEHNHYRQQQRIMRLSAQWEKNDGFKLECAHEFRDKMGRIERERSDD